MRRESLDYDALIVGGGPAGLAAAIRLRQSAIARGIDARVCLIEKGAAIGSHSISGAVIDPLALSELLPGWTPPGAPVETPVTENRFFFLTGASAWRIPEKPLPACFGNTGNFIVSLASLCRWLARQAEELGVEIYPGFTGAEILFGENEGTTAVFGVVTGDAGVSRDGTPGPDYRPGTEVRARYSLFAEGSRGHLGKQMEEKFHLRKNAAPQRYSLGLKELWEIPSAAHRPGLVLHTCGWPLDARTFGGGFIYHLSGGLVSAGFVVGLDYTNPYLSPFEEFQRFKTHSALAGFFSGGRRLAYGARTMTEGGLPSLPNLVFPGGALIGDDAGFLNAARLKGVHTAIRSGILAADALIEAIASGRGHDELTDYPARFRKSGLFDELYAARNFRPAMEKGIYAGGLIFGADQTIFRGKAPWTLRSEGGDHEHLGRAPEYRPIGYPKPDGRISFDRPSSVYLANTTYGESQPCPLRLNDPALPLQVNLPRYDAPEQRYCPAGVFEIVRSAEGEARLCINAQNCLHCKTCDIKDPSQNILWMPPEGGDGPNYPDM
ncbi:MAG: electron transfer flavoprotein-ubiquinone oxidoreductase [Candidatus Accumulibacter sp.]|jgi:electron-transferring-flavoprotein dehydrogenase|nr:electron transfer flavoprotein-ubiquinone oxidoreductase [Accumulibacter sp.]